MPPRHPRHAHVRHGFTLIESPFDKLRTTRRGFTLIELLVVVSIIALLISILLPSLRQARDAAQMTVCKSNLRQIGVGTLTYNVEYGSVPISRHPTSFAWPLMYMNKNAPLIAEFEELANEYLGAPHARANTKGWTPGTWGVLECPGKRTPYEGDRTGVHDVSYLSAGWIGAWAGLTYGADPDGDGVPRTRHGLTVQQNKEGFNIFGYTGWNRWDHSNGLYIDLDRQGVFPDEARNPSAWPLFCDQAIYAVNTRPRFNSNHGDQADPIGLNTLYLDGSVEDPGLDENWVGDKSMISASQFATWYAPTPRLGGFDSENY